MHISLASVTQIFPIYSDYYWHYCQSLFEMKQYQCILIRLFCIGNNVWEIVAWHLGVFRPPSYWSWETLNFWTFVAWLFSYNIDFSLKLNWSGSCSYMTKFVSPILAQKNLTLKYQKNSLIILSSKELLKKHKVFTPNFQANLNSCVCHASVFHSNLGVFSNQNALILLHFKQTLAIEPKIIWVNWKYLSKLWNIWVTDASEICIVHFEFLTPNFQANLNSMCVIQVFFTQL